LQKAVILFSRWRPRWPPLS